MHSADPIFVANGERGLSKGHPFIRHSINRCFETSHEIPSPVYTIIRPIFNT